MVEYRKGTPRNQIHLFQTCLDELIEEDNIVRFIDAYVESLDMYGLGFKMNENVTGAPAYRPQLKLKIYIYGYLNRIRASRQLEQECGRNKKLIWLMEGLQPDFKTIADFRKDNRKALRNVFKDFMKYCHRLGLISLRVAAIDGTKIRGQNGLNEVYRREKIDEIEKDLDERVKRYLKEMDELDEREEKEGLEINKQKVAEITRKIKRTRRKQEKLEEAKDFFENHPKEQKYCATDPDYRLQKDKGTAHPGYNAQVAVEEKNKLIVVSDVTNENNDKKQLTPMVEKVKEVKSQLSIEEQTDGVADAGYFSEKGVLKNKDDENVRITVSPEKESAKPKEESGEQSGAPQEYENKDFHYEGVANRKDSNKDV